MAIKTPFIRTPYNYDMDIESEVTGLLCEDDTLAQQHFKEECDINTIVRRFGLTGELPNDFRPPQSGDFTNIPSFEEAMNAVRRAQEAFDSMPAATRARFDNNPQKLIAFLENDKNRDEALELGLINKPPERTRDMIDAVDELKAHFVSTQPKPEK